MPSWMWRSWGCQGGSPRWIKFYRRVWYTGGVMDDRIRRLVLERFGYRCAACGSRVGLQVHHKVPRSRFGKKRLRERDDPENLEVLCAACHSKQHERKFLVDSQPKPS